MKILLRTFLSPAALMVASLNVSFGATAIARSRCPVEQVRNQRDENQLNPRKSRPAQTRAPWEITIKSAFVNPKLLPR